MNPAQPHTMLPHWFPFLMIPFWLVMFFAITFALSRLSGRSLLARRFRAQEPWTGQSWGGQSARFRGWCNYNGCLTVGASPEALYLKVMPLFSGFSPALLIPWREIDIETGKLIFGWYDTAMLRIGIDERVSVRIYGKLVNRLREAAGPGWPLYQQEQIEAQTKGIQEA